MTWLIYDKWGTRGSFSKTYGGGDGTNDTWSKTLVCNVTISTNEQACMGARMFALAHDMSENL